MARRDLTNPFIPRLLQPPQVPLPPVFSEDVYNTRDKWVVAALVGFFGGGFAYFLYKKNCRGGTVTSYRVVGNNVKQAIRNPNDDEHEFSCICELPAELRTRIWKTLSYQDLLNLRLTSKFTKYDIETYVGLNGRIATSDREKFDFYQRIALQSCKITELHEPIDQDFFLNPNILQTLEIREHIPIDLENIRHILAVCINLRYLKLRLTLNENTGEISRIVLEHLPNMKLLTFLHVRTKSHYLAETKNYEGNNASGGGVGVPLYAFSTPKQMKSVHLEMPDLPEEELSRWKSVLDKQIQIESLIANLGNVNWRFYEQVLRQNTASMEKLVLEGLRGWEVNRDMVDPLDWNIFSNFTQLRSVDLSCNRGGDHDLVESINFDTFPCLTIEEFFVSRIILPPQAVERVYTDMVNLQRGALDHIGNAGIERATEMAWIVQQAEGNENEGWWADERLWDLVAHGIFALTTAIVLAIVVKARSNEGPVIFGDAVHFFNSLAGPGSPNNNMEDEDDT